MAIAIPHPRARGGAERVACPGEPVREATQLPSRATRNTTAPMLGRGFALVDVCGAGTTTVSADRNSRARVGKAAIYGRAAGARVSKRVGLQRARL
jgi:hypothetical protein